MIEENLETYVSEYNAGLTIREISQNHNVSYESVRKCLKNKVDWRRKYVSDFTEEEVNKVLSMFDNGKSVKEIANWFEISGPAISRLLLANNRKPDSSARRYDLLRATPISFKQKQFIVGHL